MEEKVVKLSNGKTVTLRKPTAGARNKAAREAYLVSKDEKGQPYGYVNEAQMLNELVPHCIKDHPWGNVPVRQALDSLSIEDYDLIAFSLAELLKNKNGDVLGKSAQP